MVNGKLSLQALAVVSTVVGLCMWPALPCLDTIKRDRRQLPTHLSHVSILNIPPAVSGFLVKSGSPHLIASLISIFR
jgi:hypothetical protein